MSGPSVYFTAPTFGFLPDGLPPTLPPPVKERSFRAPFGIDRWLFNAALKPEVPITFASLYVVAVFTLNAYNRRRNHKPWWISRTSFFHYFVIIHNALLTIYSAATFFAMVRAIVHTWPGLNTEIGLAGVADALCKIHGPRGLGDAATYNNTINIWEVKNAAIKLGYNGNPDPTDVGRLWNEGLAFWGWMFYVSKFYEVLDTLIILAKGKRSATLQTYHHAGAMLCMWAGIRYMSPPIWMFVFVNSFIHALMYTYFTLSAVGIKVPNALKRTLTSMQIAQFVWGASYAAAHLFIQYDIPIATPYQIARTVQAAASSVSSAASSAASAAAHTASKVVDEPIASGTLVALVKKLLLRAVGEEGIAERVTTNQGRYITPGIEEKIEQFNEQAQHKAQSAQQKFHEIFETRYRTEWTKTNCIDTSGEAFAIYLNLLYLAPLTFLFLRFFVKAYTGRGKPRRASHAAKQVTDSAKVASDITSETVEKGGRKVEDEIIKAEAELKNINVNDLKEQLRKDVAALKNGKFGRDSRRVSDQVQSFERQVKSAAESVKEQTKKAAKNTKEQANKVAKDAKEQADKVAKDAKAQADKAAKDAKAQADKAAKDTKEQAEKVAKNTGSPRNQQSSTKKVESATQQESPQSQDDAEKQAAAQEALKHPQATSESEEKQEEILASSEALRPGEDGEGESSFKREENVSYSQVVKEGDFNDSTDFSSTSRSESYSRSFTSSSHTENDESGGDSVFGFGREEDTDAMGKSGAIVDYVADKAEDAKDKAEETVSSVTDS